MKPLNILLADDTRSVGLFITEYLRGAGHKVTYVESGEEAVAAYKSQAFDLVLMDVIMPGIGGLEAVKQIKAIPATTWVPVIVITGLDAEEDVLGGFMAGADDYMVKPIKPMTLDIRIRSMMRIAAIQRSTAAIVESVIEGIIQIDRVGRICHFNKAAEYIFGYSAAEVLGKNVNMLMPSPYKDNHDEYIANFVGTGHAKVIGKGRFVTGLRKNGEAFPMHLGVTEAATPDGKFFIGLVRDISEQEAARLSLEASARAVTESELFLKSITNAMPGLIAYWDSDLRCRFANKPYLEWFGKTPEAMIGIHIQELLGDQLYATNEPYIQGALRGESQLFERSITKVNGSVGYTLSNYVSDFDAKGTVAGFFVLVSDVTPIKAAEVELKLAASVFTHTIEGIFVTDGDGIILSVNPAFTTITGYTAAEAIGQTPRILRSDRHDEEFHAYVWRDIAANGKWQGEIWNRRKGGEVFIGWQTITKVPGSGDEPVRYISVFQDITELWRKDEYIRHMAFHDALTDLPNRSLLIELLTQQIALAERENRILAVMFLDLDGFKQVNDTLGHEVGDALLKTVAEKLLKLVRQSDCVARLGGDEFVILLNNPANQDEVSLIADRIVAVINQPMELAGKAAQVGVSIGIAMFPQDGKKPNDLLKNADFAMYETKKSGKCAHRFYSPSTTMEG